MKMMKLHYVESEQSYFALSLQYNFVALYLWLDSASSNKRFAEMTVN